ncbi:MAG: EF-hand domain-containing protein [Planctomycetota bacterium]|jgi:hypothetical protein
MKRRCLAIIAGLGSAVLMPVPAEGDFDGVTAELAAQPTIDGVEWDVWRVYAQVTNPEDRITFCSGNGTNPVMIEAGGPNGFYQNETFGPNNIEPSSVLIELDPDLAHDTFMTIGTEVLNEAPTQTQGLDSPGWLCDRLILRNGGWYRLPDQPLTVAGPSLQVLIAQFTVDRGAALAGSLRIAGIFDGDNTNFYVVDLPNALCDSDVDRDGAVTIDDFVELFFAWGVCDDVCDCPADVNKDGGVDVDDMLQVIADWGACP